MYTTSATLLERVRLRTDDLAWDRFVKLYTPFLCYCAKRLGLSDPDVADAVQDVFILLLDKLPAFQATKNGSFRGWLRTVTVNKCRERFRKRHETATGGSDPGPIQLATTWQACWQTTVKDRSVAEVAAELGITLNAVYVARSRVLRHLREELRDLIED